MAKTAPPTPLTLGKRDYVILESAAYERLCAAAEDAADIATVAEYDARVAAGEEEEIPLAVIEARIAGDNPVRVWRKHRGYTLRQLAARAGISTSYLSQIETGQREGTLATMARVAAALGLDLDDLAPVATEGGESA